MTLLAVLLFVNAAFAVIVWPTFFRRVVRDPRARDASGRPTPFLTVHTILFAVALAIALASVIAGIAGLTGAI